MYNKNVMSDSPSYDRSNSNQQATRPLQIGLVLPQLIPDSDCITSLSQTSPTLSLHDKLHCVRKKDYNLLYITLTNLRIYS